MDGWMAVSLIWIMEKWVNLCLIWTQVLLSVWPRAKMHGTMASSLVYLNMEHVPCCRKRCSGVQISNLFRSPLGSLGQQLVHLPLAPYKGFALAYLDDIIIFRKTWKGHLGHLEEVFCRLKYSGLKIKLGFRNWTTFRCLWQLGQCGIGSLFFCISRKTWGLFQVRSFVTEHRLSMPKGTEFSRCL